MEKRRRTIAFQLITAAIPVAVAVAGLVGLEMLWRRQSKVPYDTHSLSQRLAESERTEVRVISTGDLKGLVRPSAFENVIYELKPSREWLFLGAKTQTNRLGFRGREYDVQKPSDTYRIVGLGDSVLFGWGVDQDKIYTAQLERRLSASGHRVEVLNLGVPGYNTIQEVGLLAGRGLELSPDIVFVNYCLNDYAAPFLLPDGDGGIIERSVLVERLRQKMGLTFKEANRHYTEMQGLKKVVTALQELSQLAKQHDFPVVFFVYPEEQGRESEPLFRKWASDLGFTYVDLYSIFDDYYRTHGLKGLKDLYVRPGDSHPSPEGHTLIADALEPVLAKLLLVHRAPLTRASGEAGRAPSP